MKTTIGYRVYEVTKETRKNGRVIKDFKTTKAAEKCMNKSIYRFIKEIKICE